MPISDLPKILEGYRVDRRKSQSAAAREAGISRQSLHRWESGLQTPTLDSLAALLDVYGISWHRLADDLEGQPSIEGEYVLEDAEQIRALSDAIAEAVTKSLARNS